MTASNSCKRGFEEDELDIKLAAASQPLVANRAILAAFSICVRGLPSDAAVWDLSNLLLDGQPVQQPVVVAWLNVVYHSTLDEPFEQQENDAKSSMVDLANLLAFADAVGSTLGLLRDCCGHLKQLDATLGDRQLQLKVETGVGYSWGQSHQLHESNGSAHSQLVASAHSKEDEAALAKQVAQQMEALLFLAHKLQLLRLQEQLHAFIKSNTHLQASLLYGQLGAMLSPRVLDAAASNTESYQQAFLNSFITEQGGFVKHMHAEQLMKPLDLPPQHLEPLKFNAVMMRDCLGCKQGETAAIELSLLGAQPTLQVGNNRHVVQLLVGPVVRDAESKQAIMGPTNV